jgi:hypothetical protein
VAIGDRIDHSRVCWIGGWESDQMASSLPLGSVKWKRRPPGKEKIGFTKSPDEPTSSYRLLRASRVDLAVAKRFYSAAFRLELHRLRAEQRWFGYAGGDREAGGISNDAEHVVSE